MKQRMEWILLCAGLILFAGLIAATASGALDTVDHTVSLAAFHLRFASLNTLLKASHILEAGRQL